MRASSAHYDEPVRLAHLVSVGTLLLAAIVAASCGGGSDATITCDYNGTYPVGGQIVCCGGTATCLASGRFDEDPNYVCECLPENDASPSRDAATDRATTDEVDDLAEASVGDAPPDVVPDAPADAAEDVASDAPAD